MTKVLVSCGAQCLYANTGGTGSHANFANSNPDITGSSLATTVESAADHGSHSRCALQYHDVQTGDQSGGHLFAVPPGQTYDLVNFNNGTKPPTYDPNYHHTYAVAFASFSLAWVAGCTTTAAHVRPTAPTTPAASGSPGVSRVEFDALLKQFTTWQSVDPQGDIAITLAVLEATRQCMAEQGASFTYDPSEITSEITHKRVSGNPGQTVVDPLPAVNEATGYGFHTGAVAYEGVPKPSLPPLDSTDPDTTGMTTAEADHYYGLLNGVHPTSVPDPSDLGGPAGPYQYGGCNGDALTRVWGEPIKSTFATAVRNNAGMEITSAIESDSDYVTALLGWRQCMSGQGYDYKSPQDEHDALADLPDKTSQRFQQIEMKAATADIACRKSSNLAQARQSAAEKATRAFIVEWELEMLKIQRDRKAALANAKQILAHASATP